MRDGSDFWSRRRARVEAESEAEAAAVDAEVQAAEMAVVEEKSDAEICAELGLTDPDEMQAGDDFSAFMAKSVPQRLKLRALKKLWLTNPVLANIDGLVDYGEDFTDAACVIENLQTSYQVGKGMKAHVEEMERQAALEEAGERDDEGAPCEEDEDLLADDEAGDEDEVELETVAYEAPEQDEADLDAPAPRRRMRFEFEEHGEMGA